MSNLYQELGSDLNNSHQIAALSGEVERTRRLCLKLLREHADAHGGNLLSQIQSDELKASLRGAWEELERKQGYLQSAVQEAADLRAQMEPLNASLQDAWAELERKQSYLEAAVASAQALQDELAALRASK